MHREPRTAATMFSVGDIARELTPKKYFKKGDAAGSQVLVLEDVAVFRSGTFRDSMGYQMTWEDIHIDQMVAYFDMLRARNIFADVPIRSGHPGWLVSGTDGTGKVVGYHTSLRAEKRTSTHDGQEYYYLIAAYEIIDPAAQEAINTGLWRNRSAEVGTYVTNNDAEFWPVYQGVAYVDIPAVEGLNGFSKQNNISFMMEEGSMSDTTTPQAPVAPQAPALPAPVTTASHSAPAAPETTAAPVAQHAAPTQVQMFSINGQQTSDFAAVQSHITALELFQRETIEQSRADFVKGLVTGNKVLATQEEGLVAFCKTLDDTQFAAWKASMETTPVQPILGTYGAPQGTEAQVTGAPVDAAADALAVDKAVVQQHKRANMAADKIKATASYKRVIAADPQFVL